MGLHKILASKRIQEPAKQFAEKLQAFVDVLDQLASEPVVEARKEKAKTLFWEILVRARAMNGSDLFVDEAKKGGDNG